MAGQDTRVSDRIPAAMRIKLKYPDIETFIQKYSVNISRGGIFIATRTPKPVGTLVRFEFQLANSTPVIRGEGQVIWIKAFDPAQPKKVHGMGVRFTRLDSESRALVDRALTWKRENFQERQERPEDRPEDRSEDRSDRSDDAAESESSTPGSLAGERTGPDRVETSFSGPLPLPLPETSSPHELATDVEADTDGPTGQTLVPLESEAAAAAALSASTTGRPSAASFADEEVPRVAPVTRSQADNEAVAELWQSSQSNIVRAARHIAELTAAHIYYPEDTDLAELLKPLRIPLPLTGREASRLLAPLLDGLRA